MGKIITIISVVFLPIVIAFTVIIVFFSAVMASSATSKNTGFGPGGLELLGVNEAVLSYQPIIEYYAKQHSMSDYVYVIMAIMMQESGGAGNDPMQSSESKCGSIGCITDPSESIEQGIIHFKSVLEVSDNNLLVALQSYNFGTGFSRWIKDKGGDYTLELATQYSQEIYAREVASGRGHLYSCKIGNASSLGACYGDYLYVQHVMRYLSYDGAGEGLGSGVWSNPLTIPMQVTSPFGMRHHPISGGYKMHNGTDFSCNRQNIPLRPVDSGVVVISTFGSSGSGFGGFGNVVVIKHSESLYSLYAHLDQRYVTNGQTVHEGTILGTCGNTGSSTAIHLHLEARTSLHGGQIDPMRLLTR